MAKSNETLGASLRQVGVGEAIFFRITVHWKMRFDPRQRKLRIRLNRLGDRLRSRPENRTFVGNY